MMLNTTISPKRVDAVAPLCQPIRLRFNLRALLTCCIVSIACSWVRAADENSEFAPAVSHAQSRMVKIFGAGIGRSPGYATGLIVSPDGDIVTAVGVHLSTSNLRVITPDGETHFAKL